MHPQDVKETNLLSNLNGFYRFLIPDVRLDQVRKFFCFIRHCKEERRSRLPHAASVYVFKLLLLLFTFPAFTQNSQETIKIGFLIRDKGDLAILQTAQHAIDEANAKGGYKGQKFELAIKSCDGPWGVTSKQTVALIYDDQVPIVVTALDGRNAHLAEQVTAKSHVVMLSTLTSDPTLSRAYVPWYYRMVPDDKQQASALVDEIYIENKARDVAIKADYSSLRASAELFAMDNSNSYALFCSDPDYTKASTAATGEHGSGGTNCNDSASAWAACAQLVETAADMFSCLHKHFQIFLSKRGKG